MQIDLLKIRLVQLQADYAKKHEEAYTLKGRVLELDQTIQTLEKLAKIPVIPKTPVDNNKAAEKCL